MKTHRARHFQHGSRAMGAVRPARFLWDRGGVGVSGRGEWRPGQRGTMPQIRRVLVPRVRQTGSDRTDRCGGPDSCKLPGRSGYLPGGASRSSVAPRGGALAGKPKDIINGRHPPRTARRATEPPTRQMSTAIDRRGASDMVAEAHRDLGLVPTVVVPCGVCLRAGEPALRQSPAAKSEASTIPLVDHAAHVAGHAVDVPRRVTGAEQAQ